MLVRPIQQVQGKQAHYKTITKSPEETALLAEKILKKIREKRDTIAQGAVILLLSGDLGSGKTTFTQGLARALGISETVTSPTFIIEKIYKLENNTDFDHLIHIDAYRLEGKSEAELLNLETLFADPRSLIAIEWPEYLGADAPKEGIFLSFEFINDKEREIDLLHNNFRDEIFDFRAKGS
jgi:tRNA threonylcarbamoyladenosine biosynthesis protein TsaE